MRVGPDARAGAGRARHAVRRGHVRVGAVVDVEEACPARPRTAPSCPRAARGRGCGRCGPRRARGGGRARAARRRARRGRSPASGAARPARSSSPCARRSIACAERRRVEQVGDADAAARHLVLVGRADAAAGGADRALARAPRRAPCRARCASRGSRARARRRARREGSRSTPCAWSSSSSREQHARVDHDAGADQVHRAGLQDAGRAPGGGPSSCRPRQRVAGVVAAVEAHDEIGARARASRRSCPCPRRPTGRRPRRAPSRAELHELRGDHVRQRAQPLHHRVARRLVARSRASPPRCARAPARAACARC